jgi:hypothetical protein
MENQSNTSRPSERQAVFTTIVGGRPPGSGTDLGPIPRGIEVLVKKAAVDPRFRALLLEKRADAARQISLELTPAETAMLAAIPRKQLDAIIANTKVKPKSRRIFLGKAASVMLAALGVNVSGCKKESPDRGVRPDPPIGKGIQPDRPEPTDSPQDANSPIRGIRPDQRRNVTLGIRPDPTRKE